MKKSLIEYVESLEDSKMKPALLRLVKLHSDELNDEEMYFMRMSKEKKRLYDLWDDSKIMNENRKLNDEIQRLFECNRQLLIDKAKLELKMSKETLCSFDPIDKKGNGYC